MKSRRRCADEIQRALKDLGPATIEMVERVTGIGKKDLRQSMALLRKRGLVDMLVGDERTFYYQLNQSLAARTNVARNLKCSESELIKPMLRRQDRYHNQWCEYWSLLIKRAFSNVVVIRDYSIEANEIAREVLLLDEMDYELLPDLLVIFTGEDQRRTVVALEIERTRKSNKRLLRKFRRYLEETQIDGLVYVCDSGRLAETLRALYESQLLGRAERVKHYAESFFLFSHSLTALSTPLESFLNVNAQQVSLIDWCGTLKTKSRLLRRNSDFAHA